MYRLLLIPELHQVLIINVPECHRSKNQHRPSYILADTINKAESIARLLLDNQDKREKYLYDNGITDIPKSKYEWLRNSDAVVGRRILNRDNKVCKVIG